MLKKNATSNTYVCNIGSVILNGGISIESLQKKNIFEYLACEYMKATLDLASRFFIHQKQTSLLHLKIAC